MSRGLKERLKEGDREDDIEIRSEGGEEILTRGTDHPPIFVLVAIATSQWPTLKATVSGFLGSTGILQEDSWELPGKRSVY